jgi:uncharacterized protein YsxB (DUF464 family)
MELKIRKESGDYPQFQFRISEEEKKLIQHQIEVVLKQLNSLIGPDHKKFKKNDVIIEAIKRGLKSLDDEYKKKA